MGDGRPFTKEHLMLSLRIKAHGAGYVLPLREWISGTEAEFCADAIRTYGLADVIAGRHDSKPVTFAKGFELVFGERLTLKGAA